MADISKINPNGTTYNLKDETARNSISAIEAVIPNSASATNQLLTAEPLTVTDGSNTGLITFGIDANGNYGYKKVGADTVTPFSTNNINFTYFEIRTNGSTSGSISFFRISEKDLYLQCGFNTSTEINIYARIAGAVTNNNMTYTDAQNFINNLKSCFTDLFEVELDYTTNGVLYLKNKTNNNIIIQGYNNRNSNKKLTKDYYINGFSTGVTESASKVLFNATGLSTSPTSFLILNNASF